MRLELTPREHDVFLVAVSHLLGCCHEAMLGHARLGHHEEVARLRREHAGFSVTAAFLNAPAPWVMEDDADTLREILTGLRDASLRALAATGGVPSIDTDERLDEIKVYEALLERVG